jgi:hypothetical protein
VVTADRMPLLEAGALAATEAESAAPWTAEPPVAITPSTSTPSDTLAVHTADTTAPWFADRIRSLDSSIVNLEFSGEVWFWKGPAPWHFVTVPEQQSAEIEAVSALVTYGWGVIPVTARIGATSWQTSLFPKDGQYLVPVKTQVRKAEAIELGDLVTVSLIVELSRPPHS